MSSAQLSIPEMILPPWLPLVSRDLSTPPMKPFSVPSYRIYLVILLLMGLLASPLLAHADDASDPLEPFNRSMFQFNRQLDRHVLKPVAQTYQKVTPSFVRLAVTNFFSNLQDVYVFANDLLQFKFQQAIVDSQRVIYNSTFGLGGVIDIATPGGLPKHHEDFGQTLGYWGVGEGYYLVLPFLGPSSTRDVWSWPVDGYLLDPVSYLDSVPARYSLRGLYTINTRASLLKASNLLEQAAIDPYTFEREAYLQRRRSLVNDGKSARPSFNSDDQGEDHAPSSESNAAKDSQ